MKTLPTCNSLIQYEDGDGFRSVLPNMLLPSDILVVQNKGALSLMARALGKRSVEIVTLHTLHKIKAGNYSRVVVDAYLPQANCKAARALRKLARDKTVVLTRPLHKPSDVNTALFILSATKSAVFKVFPFSLFMYNYRGGF